MVTAAAWRGSWRSPSYPDPSVTRRPHILLALLAMVAVSCTSGQLVSIPDPPEIPVTTTTTLVDYSAIDLAGVPGRTTTTVAAGPGGATLTGTVVGPDGPVEGAVVRAERLVGDSVVGSDVLTQPDGTWTMPEVFGGRYRVRAWRVPDQALVTPEIFFLDNTENKTLNLALTRYEGLAASGAVAPDPPIVDAPSNLAVQVTERTVDDQGVVRGVPRAAVNVELFGSGDWQLQSSNPAVSDVGGVARFRLVCRRAGDQPLSVVIADSRSFPLTIPPCAVPPPDPDEVEPTSTTTTPRSTTTTSRASTTTTNRTSTSTTSSSTTIAPQP